VLVTKTGWASSAGASACLPPLLSLSHTSPWQSVVRSGACDGVVSATVRAEAWATEWAAMGRGGAACGAQALES